MSHRRQPDVVYEFEAGRRTIRALINHFQGKAYLDPREYYEPEPGKPLAPTKRGVCVGVEYLDELQEAIAALANSVSSRTPAVQPHGSAQYRSN